MREIKLSPADVVADGNHYYTPDAEVDGVLYVEGVTVTDVEDRDGGEPLIHIQSDLGWTGGRSADHLYVENSAGEIEAMTYERIGSVITLQILVDGGGNRLVKKEAQDWAESALPDGVGAIKKAHVLGVGPGYDKTEHVVDRDGEVLAISKPHYEHDYPTGIVVHGEVPVHRAVASVVRHQVEAEQAVEGSRPQRGPWSPARKEAFRARIREGASDGDLKREFGTTDATIAKYRAESSGKPE